MQSCVDAVLHQPQVAEQCLIKAKDLSGMLLLYSSRGSVAGIASLAEQAKALGKHNVTFVCLFLLGQLDECIDLLIECGRVPEATFFARTYLPSRLVECVHGQLVVMCVVSHAVTLM